MKKQRKQRRHNPVARALSSPLFRQRTLRSRKAYSRKTRRAENEG